MDPNLSISENRGPSQGEQGSGEGQSKSDQRLKPQQLFCEIKRAITKATRHEFLTYEDVDPEIGSLVVSSLNQDAVVESIGPR